MFVQIMLRINLLSYRRRVAVHYKRYLGRHCGHRHGSVVYHGEKRKPDRDAHRGHSITGHGVLAQIERESIHQMQTEGIAAAKAKAKGSLGWKADPLPDRLEAVCARCYNREVTTREAAAAPSMSPTTFYRHFLA